MLVLQERVVKKPKLYMLCLREWDEGYVTFMKEYSPFYEICPVTHDNWVGSGTLRKLCDVTSAHALRIYDEGIPEDLSSAITVLPVVTREVIAKTALCLCDTEETRWITANIEAGGTTIFWQNGLKKFTGNETPAYQRRITDYLRNALEYGIQIGNPMESSPKQIASIAIQGCEQKAVPTVGQKKVITVANLQQHIHGGVLTLGKQDIITALAREMANQQKIQINQM